MTALQIPELTGWLCAKLGLVAPLSFELIPAGRSNLTYLVTDHQSRRVIVRRAPEGHVLESAHDVVREHRLLTAVHATAVPVPRPLALCRDAEVTAVPVLVMEYVDGLVPSTPQQIQSPTDFSAQVVDTLLALHEIDPDAIGLGDLGPGKDYARRQLARWSAQSHYMLDLVGRPLPLLQDVCAELKRTLPVQQRTAVIHGDYRPANLIVSPEGRVRAVLDWELATRGDPLCDLAHLLVGWSGGGWLPDAASLVARYDAGSSLDLGTLPWYEAFARWRGACIDLGVWARYAAGAPAGDVLDLEPFEASVMTMLEEASALLDHARPVR